MKQISKCLLLCLSLFAAHLVMATPLEPDSPVGIWKTIDDVTGKPKGIVEITAGDDNTISAKILRIFPRPGHDQNETCINCKGSRHGQPIVGMVFLEKLQQDAKNPKEWSGGTILDPQNGKEYKCYVQVKNNGKELMVRGYIGFSLFGRTQTWIRASEGVGA